MTDPEEIEDLDTEDHAPRFFHGLCALVALIVIIAAGSAGIAFALSLAGHLFARVQLP